MAKTILVKKKYWKEYVKLEKEIIFYLNKKKNIENKHKHTHTHKKMQVAG